MVSRHHSSWAREVRESNAEDPELPPKFASVLFPFWETTIYRLKYIHDDNDCVCDDNGAKFIFTESLSWPENAHV